MRRNTAAVLLSMMALLLPLGNGCAAPAKVSAGDVPRMQADELKARLGDPGLIIIDVRQPSDWEASSTKIKGAIRELYNKVSDWASRYQKDKTIVLYCA